MNLYILDTDHLSLWQRGNNRLLKKLSSVPPNHVATTVINVEEQMQGRLAQLKRAKDKQQMVIFYGYFLQTKKLLCQVPVLPFSEDATQLFFALKEEKTKVGTQDLKIAAVALSVGAVLLTRNKKDFDRIPGLKIEDWTLSD